VSAQMIAIDRTTAKILLFTQIFMTDQQKIQEALKKVEFSVGTLQRSNQDSKEIVCQLLREIYNTLTLISQQLAAL
jgi:hypothetical protein